MKLPSFKRLFKGDYAAEFQNFVEVLSVSLNIGIESLYTALNRKLTMRDNFQCVVRDIQVSVDASGIPNTTTTFTTDILGQVDGIQVIRAQNLTNTISYPTGGIFISFTQIQGAVRIDHITGLQANNDYSLRIVAWIV